MRIVFQGDSITDAGRDRTGENPSGLGQGYVNLLAATLGARHPGRGYEILNRGIGGDRVESLHARWQADTLSLRPDVLSILVGINDAFIQRSVDPSLFYDGFTETYRLLLRQFRGFFPEAKLVLMEPFTLDAGNYDYLPEVLPHLRKKQNAARALAEEFDAVFVPLQARFEAAAKLAPAAYWLSDSVHPTPAGHGLIAEAWIEDTKTLFT